MKLLYRALVAISIIAAAIAVVINVVGMQGTMQVLTIVIMARFVAGL
jgi:hypothetical protein